MAHHATRHYVGYHSLNQVYCIWECRLSKIVSGISLLSATVMNIWLQIGPDSWLQLCASQWQAPWTLHYGIFVNICISYPPYLLLRGISDRLRYFFQLSPPSSYCEARHGRAWSARHGRAWSSSACHAPAADAFRPLYQSLHQFVAVSHAGARQPYQL